MSRPTRALAFGLLCTLLSSLAACVPPNGQNAQYPQSSSYDDDAAYGDGQYVEGGSNGGSSGRMWYCRAEATTVYGRGIDIMNKGRTRDEAALQALKDCGSLAGLSDVTSDGNEQHPVGTRDCEISNCWYAD